MTSHVCVERLESRCMFSALGKLLLKDDFAGSAVNLQHWHLPLFTADGSTFLGRTQLAVSQNASPPRVSKGAVHLTLDTFNPTGFLFYGTELISNSSFKVGKGLRVQFRAKLNTPISRGFVGGLFLYEPKPQSLHDEVDVELLSNQVFKTNQVQTNVYANEPLGAGSPRFVSLPQGGKLSGYHTYEMTCYPDRVTWTIDGVLVRTERQKVP